MSTTNVPLVDLGASHAQIADEVEQGWRAVLGKTSFVLGEQVSLLEREYAEFVGAQYAIGVGSGTDALELALRAIGVGAGDEVIVPTMTFFATAASVVRAGARPVFVDCDSRYALIEPEQVTSKVTDKTKAIVPVHLYGQAAPMAEIQDIAERSGLHIVEDAAQAQGATQNGRCAGTYGVAAATSFYPGKNLGAYGDGGAVTTNDGALAERIKELRNYGSTKKYHHPVVGYNSRLDTLQAVVLRAKLKRLAEWNAARRAAALRYDVLLADVADVIVPQTADGNEHIWHLYVIQVDDRDRVLQSMNDAGIGAGIHYPKPLHLQGAFADHGHRKGDFPIAENMCDRILSLPMFPEITESQQERVVETLRQAIR